MEMIKDVADILGTFRDFFLFSHGRLEHRLLDRRLFDLLDLCGMIGCQLYLLLHRMRSYVHRRELLGVDLKPLDSCIDMFI